MNKFIEGNVNRYLAILGLLWVMKLCSLRYINATDPCQKEQLYSNICESPCVTQVGLSILRVTFNDFFVNSECIKKSSISYWMVNGNQSTAIEVELENNEVWKQDCTYSGRKIKHYMSSAHQNFVKPKPKRIIEVVKEQSFRIIRNHKYTYLQGLKIGGTYLLQLKISLNKSIRGRKDFSSLQVRINLSTEELFKKAGFIGNVNQGNCCNVRNLPYFLDESKGECVREITLKEKGFNINTFLLFLLIFLLLFIVIINMIFHLKKLLVDRRRYHNTRSIESTEVFFKNMNPEEMHPDILMSSRCNTMNPSLLKHSTITIRLPPHGEELLFEELKSRLTRQSI